MNYSDACVELTKVSEGLRLTVYADPAPGAFATIGYGHRVKPGEDFSAGITVAQAEEILRADLDEAFEAVNRLCDPPNGLTQGQTDALTDFTFNLGSDKLASSTLLRYVNKGWMDQAADQFDLWRFSGGVVLPGLVKRRAAEKALFLSDPQ